MLRPHAPGIAGFLLVVGFWLPGIGRAQVPYSPQEATVDSAVSVLDEIMAVPAREIPQSLLAGAEGIAIVPNVIKGGFVVGVRFGRGVVVVRDANGVWQPPVFITMTGGSVGWQVGLQATDVILVFKTRKSIEGLMSGKFTIGADAAAAAGPVGRQAAAATDARLGAEIYSYCRSRGLFAGVAVDGSVLQVDRAAHQAYYQAAGLVPGAPAYPHQLPPSAGRLLASIASYTGTGGGPAPAAAVATPVAGATAPSAADVATAVPLDNSSGSSVPPPIDTEQLRQQLAAASGRLQAIVDDSWKGYLALPSTIYDGRAAPSPAAFQEAWQRYSSVARDGRYAALAQRAEFRETSSLLQAYLQQIGAASQPRLLLPPPPNQGDSATPPTSR